MDCQESLELLENQVRKDCKELKELQDHQHPKEQKVNEELLGNQVHLEMMDPQGLLDHREKEVNQVLLVFLVLMDCLAIEVMMDLQVDQEKEEIVVLLEKEDQEGPQDFVAQLVYQAKEDKEVTLENQVLMESEVKLENQVYVDHKACQVRQGLQGLGVQWDPKVNQVPQDHQALLEMVLVVQ